MTITPVQGALRAGQWSSAPAQHPDDTTTLLYTDDQGRARHTRCRGRHCQVTNCRESVLGPRDACAPVNLPDTHTDQVIAPAPPAGTDLTRAAIAAVMDRLGCTRSDIKSPLGGDCAGHELSQPWTDDGCSLAVAVVTVDCRMPLPAQEG